MAVALVVLGALLLGTHVVGGGTRAPALVPHHRGPTRGVGLARCTFVEHTATPTFDYLTQAPSSTRTLVTQIRYPTLRGRATGALVGAPPDEAAGPYPAVFFASGYRLDPSSYGRLLDAWVRTGLVVIAPSFPYTNPGAYARSQKVAPGSNPEDDLVNEPGDLAFVVQRSLAASGGAPGCPILNGLLDPSALGLAGQSDGGQVAGMLGYDKNYVSPSLSFQAAEVLSGEANGKDPYGGGPGYPPLLVVQSSRDTCNTPSEAVGLYQAIGQSDKWFLEDHGRTHLGPYVGTEKVPFSVVAAVTGRFFDLELRGERPGARFLALGNRRPSVASLTEGPSVPAMPSRGKGGVGCYAR